MINNRFLINTILVPLMLGFLRDSDECNGLLTAHPRDTSLLFKLNFEHELLTSTLQILGPLLLFTSVVVSLLELLSHLSSGSSQQEPVALTGLRLT